MASGVAEGDRVGVRAVNCQERILVRTVSGEVRKAELREGYGA
jgi:hypothetical protein